MFRWTRIIAMTIVATCLTIGSIFAQDADTAIIPFSVNVDATIIATGVKTVSIPATANQETVLRLPLQKTIGVSFGSQSRTNVPMITTVHNGKIVINLSAHTQKNTEVSLYNVKGKRIFHTAISATETSKNIVQRNLASGIYLLSVKGNDGNLLTSRISHNGGAMNIDAIFRNNDITSAKHLTKKSNAESWTITVSATGYFDTAYTFTPVAGLNPKQNIVLRETSTTPPTTYLVTVLSISTDATGGGVYTVGSTVSVNAGTPPIGMKFQKWITTSSGVEFDGTKKETTTFTMPTNDVTVIANFELIKEGTFTDLRDNTVYNTILMPDSNIWMAENLNYQTISGSWCYDNDKSYCAEYGRLYDWKTANTICPDGWHLPSKAEWGGLDVTVGGWETAGTKLKSPVKWSSSPKVPIGTNDYGFSALPGGCRSFGVSFACEGENGEFINNGTYGLWWTSTTGIGDTAHRRYMGYDYEHLGGEDVSQNYGFSVRCIKN